MGGEHIVAERFEDGLQYDQFRWLHRSSASGVQCRNHVIAFNVAGAPLTTGWALFVWVPENQLTSGGS